MSLSIRVKSAVLLLLCATAPIGVAGSVRAHVADRAGVAVADVVVALYAATPVALTDVARGVMDQRDKQFAPRVVVVRKNTLVSFPNSDDIRHHVYSFSPAKRFELRLYHGTPSQPILFDVPGEVVLGCNIHDRMVGYIYVVDTPFFAKTDADGNAALLDIPPGSYRARIWYPGVLPDAQGLEQSIKVADADMTIDFKVATTTPQPSVPAASDLQRLFQRSGDDAY